VNSDIFDDIALNYLGRVVKAGDCNPSPFVHTKLHGYLENKREYILKRKTDPCTKFHKLSTMFT